MNKTTNQNPKLEGHPPAGYDYGANPGVRILGSVVPENTANADLQRRTRRTQIEIMVAILEAAMEGVTKTTLVYKSNLNFTLIERYIALLEKKGLLFVAIAPGGHNGGMYKTSEKGSEALTTFRDAISLAFEETTTSG